MRTPSREMMSHIFIENIFMSPFPSFEIPKMNRFRANTDSSSTIIIIGGYSILESSLHPAPVSLWLDFRYKEKKKRNRSGGNQKSKINNKRNDVALFYFPRSTVFYCATKFMFSSHKLSRKYRYFDTNGELYLGFLHVQFVPVSTLSTSCVRSDFHFSQYSFYVQYNVASNTRQFLSHAPIFKLRHLMDRNSTQLIHYLLQTNIDNNKNSNNDNNNNIILSLQYSIIERVFQNDGECIVIRFSTLIDRKERKKLSSKHENSIDDQVLLNRFNRKRKCVMNVYSGSIENSDSDNNMSVFILQELSNFNHDNEKCIDCILILLSKLLKRDIYHDSGINNNTRVLLLVPNVLRCTKMDHRGTNSIYDPTINSDNASLMTIVSKRTIANYFDASVLIQLLLNHTNIRKYIVILLPNHIDEECNNMILLIRNDKKNFIDEDEQMKSVKCLLIYHVSIHLINEYHQEEYERNVISISLIDGEYVVIILLLKLSKPTISNNKRCKEDLSKRVEQIGLFKISKRTRIDYEVNSINDCTINGDNASVLILLSKLSNHNHNEESNVENIIDSGLIQKEWNDKNSNSYNGNNDHDRTVQDNLNDHNHTIHDNNIQIVLSNCLNNWGTVLIPLSKLLNHNNNDISIILLQLLNCMNDNGNCVLIVLLSKQSKHTNSNNGDAQSDDEIILSILSKLLKYTDNDNNNKKYIDRVLILLPELSMRNDSDNIDGSISNNTSTLKVISSRNHNKEGNDKNSIDIDAPVARFTHCECIFIRVESVLLPLLKLLSKHKDDNNNNTSIALNMLLKLLKCNNNANNEKRIDYKLILLSEISNTTSASILLLESLTGKNDSNDIEKCSNSNSNDSDNNNNDNNNNDKCINCNDDGMNIIKNIIRKGINNTGIELSDDNSNDTTQIRLFIASVCTPMRSSTVLTTCILEYKYDIILKALFVFNCSILYWIFTIDGEYQNPQRVRILVNDISLYESSWNRALRLESYLSSSKQLNAAK